LGQSSKASEASSDDPLPPFGLCPAAPADMMEKITCKFTCAAHLEESAEIK
jgi:hypothetical protein